MNQPPDDPRLIEQGQALGDIFTKLLTAASVDHFHRYGPTVSKSAAVRILAEWSLLSPMTALIIALAQERSIMVAAAVEPAIAIMRAQMDEAASDFDRAQGKGGTA